MSDQPELEHNEDNFDPYDTLVVPPPSFRERLEAAQRARANHTKTSVSIMVPRETDESAASNEDTQIVG